MAAAVFVMAAVVAVWSLIATGLAAWAFRGSSLARILLTISAAGAGLFMLITVLSAPMMVVPVAACIATVVLLQRPDVRLFCSGAQRR